MALQAGAKAAIVDAFDARGFRDEIVVPLHRIRCEIGEPGKARHAGIADGQRAAIFGFVVTGFGTPPIVSILRNTGTVVGPATGIGAFFKVGDLEDKLLPRPCNHPEVEPLEEVRILVLANGELGGCAID